MGEIMCKKGWLEVLSLSRKRVVLGYLFIMLHHCYQPPKHYQHQECNLKLNLRHRKEKKKQKQKVASRQNGI